MMERSTTARGKRWLHGLAGAAALALLGVTAVSTTYLTVPTHNTNLTHFDTLLVLGCPTDPDGKASPQQRERVMAAVREFAAGRSGHIIVSGGAAHNQFNEAVAMAGIAEAAGVPPMDVVLEPQAHNTIENVWYSEQIMRQRGWKSAEVVSTPDHLPRAALILQHYERAPYNLAWRTHAARWPPEFEWRRVTPYYIYEALGTSLLRWFGYKPSPFLPTTN